jgi:V8-like Glu-specific endopeptidase
MITAQASAEQPAGFDSYLERLVKLIPAEVVGGYLVGREIAANNDAVAGWAFTCFIFVFIFRALMTQTELSWRIKLKDIQVTAVVISAISFVLWIYSLGDHIYLFPPCYLTTEGCAGDSLRWIASLALLLWTPLIPYIYQGDPEESDPLPLPDSIVDGSLSPALTHPAPTTRVDPADIRMSDMPGAMPAVETPGAQLKDIIERDDRGRVPDAKIAPYASIGLIHAFRGSERFARTIGTGWLVTNTRIVTAAHVVFGKFQLDGQASRVHVWLGYDRFKDGNPAIISSKIRVHPTYVETGDRRFDVATIDFNTSLVTRTDFPKTGGMESGDLSGQPVEIAGYPSDKGGFDMYTATGTVAATEPQRIFYDADTMKGQSGAPVWICVGRIATVVGVHVDGVEFSDHLDRKANLGVYLNSAIVDWIQGSA